MIFMNNAIDIIDIENAHIMWRNFSGKADKFNREEERNFGVIIDDPEMAERLKADGWNVKHTNPRNEDDEPVAYLKVKINYRKYPPKIFLITKRKKTLLDEDTVGELDMAEIRNVDVIISPYHYDVRGKTGISAYVKVMYVTIEEDIFASKYDFDDDVLDPDGHLPL